MKKLTTDLVKFAWFQTSASATEIAKTLSVSRSNVYKIIRKACEDGVKAKSRQ